MLVYRLAGRDTRACFGAPGAGMLVYRLAGRDTRACFGARGWTSVVWTGAAGTICAAGSDATGRLPVLSGSAAAARTGWPTITGSIFAGWAFAGVEACPGFAGRTRSATGFAATAIALAGVLQLGSARSRVK